MLDSHFLQLALAEARKRRGYTAPNPAVGAVVVKDGRVVGIGYHFAAGHPHAEVEALTVAGDDARGATIYVTLEPCCHFGRTPPCSRLVIERGLARVVYGFCDPNPKVSGQGHRDCEAAGLEVSHVSLPEIDAFYESYAHWQRMHTPVVTAKLALSLDGKVAGPRGARVQITGEGAARFTHERRRESDALLTTERTIRHDDPWLNVRLDGEAKAKPIYVLDTFGELRLDAKLFESAGRLTSFHGPEAPRERLAALAGKGVTLVEVSAEGDRLDLAAVIAHIGRDGVHDLWVEAGGTLFESLADKELLQRAYLYVAPRWLGSDAQEAFRSGTFLDSAKRLEWKSEGPDAVALLEW